MTEIATDAPAVMVDRAERIERRLKRRYAAERRFKLYGLVAICAALSFLALLFATIVLQGATAFQQTMIRLDVTFSAETVDPEGKRDLAALSTADYAALIRDSLQTAFPEVTERRERRELNQLLSPGAAFELRQLVLDDPSIIGTTRPVWLPANDDVDVVAKRGLGIGDAQDAGRLSAKQLDWVQKLVAIGALEKQFNTAFFTQGDSREPELAGIWGATVGSFFTLIVCLLLSFPVGVMAAVYLEEFAPRNRLTDLIEVNINNLAAVPSIVFGLLGLAVFLGFFGLPRSAPLVGGMVLALMSLPTIIIAGRAALKAVPPSIREAAFGVGASRLQVVTHHVVPLAMPGLLTGTIIAMAQALGETAPLLMIGMVAFIVDIPGGVFDPATVLPVQIYLWADSPERAFVERTSAAILVLLGFLICMNLAAVLLRRRFEKRW